MRPRACWPALQGKCSALSPSTPPPPGICLLARPAAITHMTCNSPSTPKPCQENLCLFPVKVLLSVEGVSLRSGGSRTALLPSFRQASWKAMYVEFDLLARVVVNPAYGSWFWLSLPHFWGISSLWVGAFRGYHHVASLAMPSQAVVPEAPCAGQTETKAHPEAAASSAGQWWAK